MQTDGTEENPQCFRVMSSVKNLHRQAKDSHLSNRFYPCNHFEKKIPCDKFLMLFRKIHFWLVALRRMAEKWRIRTRGRMELARMTDGQLKDIGFTRMDVIQECRKPFWKD